MGLFIAFEGLDGSGLSTRAKILSDWFKKEGYSTIFTKEPTSSLIGGVIRVALKKEWKTDPKTLQLLFAADRSHHLQRDVIPALGDGKVVITDRYLFSSIAYGSLEIERKWLEDLYSNFLKPDITFFIDTDPKICIERIQSERFGFELFEEEKKLRSVRKVYLELAEKYKFIKRNGTVPEDEIGNGTIKEVKRILKEKDFSLQKFIKTEK